MRYRGAGVARTDLRVPPSSSGETPNGAGNLPDRRRARTFPILPYDDAAATWHGHERARLEALGRPAPYVDGQIAAIAHASKLAVVTINTKDFSRFTGLKVENWSKRRARS